MAGQDVSRGRPSICPSDYIPTPRTMQGVQIIETEGPHPVVYGKWLGAGPDKLTVLIYGHYDVQVGSQTRLLCLIRTAALPSGLMLLALGWVACIGLR